MLKKLLAALGTLALVAGLVALVAGPASAHTHSISADCVAGVTVDLEYYATKDTDPTPNHVTVWIDDQATPVTDQAFGSTFLQSYKLSTGQASHSYRVLVYAYDNNAKYGFDTGVVTIPNCETAVTPAAATATDPYCTAAGVVGGGGYTIPADSLSVQYQLWDGTKWINIGQGAHDAAPGAAIKILVIAKTGYKIASGATTSWTFALSAPDASKCVAPTPPTANPAECITDAPGSATTAGYTVPKAPAGYSYYLQGSGTPISSTSADVTVSVTTFPTTIVLVAKANAGYTFPNNTVASWTFEFASPGDCHATVTPAAVTPQYATCTGPGTSSHNGFTVTATTGVIYQLKTEATWTTITSDGFHDLGVAAGSVEIRAMAEPHYVLTGTTDWPFTFTAANDCLQQVQAGDPTFVDGACDAAHPGTAFFGTYSVVVTSGVHYDATVNGGPSVTLVEGVDNEANPGDVVVITPVADPGYVITNVIAGELLHHTFTVPGDCLVTTPFVKPQPTDQFCVVTELGGLPTLTDAFITIPVTAHVKYYIDNVLQTVPAGEPSLTVILPPGMYKVSASPETGYAFDGYDGPWDEMLASGLPCGQLVDHPLVTPAATQVQLGCFAAGSYTVSNSLSDSAALTWTVNGSVANEGKYVVNSESTVVVHVAANGPAYGLEKGSQTDWTFHFVRPATCDLKTLALTGSTPVGWIALGYALLVSGLALLAVRVARRRGEQV